MVRLRKRSVVVVATQRAKSAHDDGRRAMTASLL
jgi:hypothetical protein